MRFSIAAISLGLLACGHAQYLPDWDSIDSRPLPDWYDQAKVGIFIHWGIYSVPAVSNEWYGEEWFEWALKSRWGFPGDLQLPSGNGSEKLNDFINKNYPPGTTYEDLAKDFTAELWNPDDWIDLFERAGAKYLVFTSKHHEGYTLWPSATSPGWNSMDVGPHRDLVGDLEAAARSRGFRFGLYHSYTDWFNPLWIQDKKNGYTTDAFVTAKADPEMYELVNNYQPDLIWSDGEWGPDTYWKAKEFLAWLYNDSPVKEHVIVNDRWGYDTVNAHGGYYSGVDRQNPGVLLPHKWENCWSLDKGSWGHRRDNSPANYYTAEELITTLAETVSCGGNILLNVAPFKDGIIPLIEQERLLQIGNWLRINGEAVYSSVPYTVQNDTMTPGLWYTSSADMMTTYAILTMWPRPDLAVHLGSIPFAGGLNIQLLGNDGNLDFEAANPGIRVTLPRAQQINTKYALTFKITR